MGVIGKHLVSVRVQVKLYTGVDLTNGKPIYRTHSLSNLRKDVTPKEAFDVVTAVYDLQEHMLHDVEQIDVSELSAD